VKEGKSIKGELMGHHPVSSGLDISPWKFDFCHKGGLFDIVGGPWALDGFLRFWFLKGVWGLFVKGHHGLDI
jgi:hypothetical protein